MLSSIQIKNFRGFRDLQIEPLERINLIAGRNNAGKTALLEAIFLHLGPTRPEFGTIIHQWRNLQPSWDIAETWSTLFYNLEANRTIEISSQDDKGFGHTLELSLPETGTNRIVRTTPDSQSSSAKSLESMAVTGRAKRDLLLNYHDSGGKASKTLVQAETDGTKWSWVIQHEKHIEMPMGVFVPTRLHSPQEDAAHYSKLAEVGQEEIVLAALKLLEPRLSKLTVLVRSGVPIVHGDIGIGRLLPLPVMGEGLARLLTLLLAIATSNGGIILIDEIENGFHYSAFKKIWRAIAQAARRFDAQIFATTHNWECIKAAHEAVAETELYDLRLHRLDRAQAGTIRSVSYKQNMLDTALATDLEVR